jgi:hypothetical protein
MRRPNGSPLALIILFAACNQSSIAPPVDAGPDLARRLVTPIPAPLPAEDWIPFSCATCPGDPASGLRAVRCDGSAELLFDLPFAGAVIEGARFVGDNVVVAVQDGSNWALWARGANGQWRNVLLGNDLGSPFLDAFRNPPSRQRNRLVYGRSFDGSRGVDAVAYFDLDVEIGYDYVGRRNDQPDVSIVFATLGADTLATYFHSPSGVLGPSETLDIGRVGTLSFQSSPAPRPDQLAGLADNTVALLAAGEVTLYDALGKEKGKIAGPVTAIYAPSSGGLAYASAGDLYCVPPGGGTARRLTTTAASEALFGF